MDLTPESRIGERPENPTVATATPKMNPKKNPFIDDKESSSNDDKL